MRRLLIDFKAIQRASYRRGLIVGALLTFALFAFAVTTFLVGFDAAGGFE